METKKCICGKPPNNKALVTCPGCKRVYCENKSCGRKWPSSASAGFDNRHDAISLIEDHPCLLDEPKTNGLLRCLYCIVPDESCDSTDKDHVCRCWVFARKHPKSVKTCTSYRCLTTICLESKETFCKKHRDDVCVQCKTSIAGRLYLNSIPLCSNCVASIGFDTLSCKRCGHALGHSDMHGKPECDGYAGNTSQLLDICFGCFKDVVTEHAK